MLNTENAEMSKTKLGLSLLFLGIIWAMCYTVELQLPYRHQLDLEDKIGGKDISDETLSLYSNLYNNVEGAENKLKEASEKKYLLDSKEQGMCVVVRDFHLEEHLEKDYNTVKSIITQDYKNYHIVYLSKENDKSKETIERYLLRSQITEPQYKFVTTEDDNIHALLEASKYCNDKEIMVILEDQEELSSKQALKILNSKFTEDTSLIWSNTMYKDKKLGFTVPYPEEIVSKKNYKYYTFLAREFTAFRAIELKSLIEEYYARHKFALLYPLWLHESYIMQIMINSKNTPRYLADILSFRRTDLVPFEKRGEVKKKLSKTIIKGQPLLPVLREIDELAFSNKEEIIFEKKIGEKGISNTLNQIYADLYYEVDSKQAEDRLNDYIDSKYRIKAKEQEICIVLRDFHSTEKHESDYKTIQSISEQDYQTYTIIHVSKANDEGRKEAKKYLTDTTINKDRYKVVDSEEDNMEALFKASEKCSENGIMVIMDDEEELSSKEALTILDSVFNEETSVAWSNTMYKDGNLGFSVPYPAKVIAEKSYSDHVFVANEFTAFRNSELKKVKEKYEKNKFMLAYPLWLHESYMLEILKNTENKPRYISDILSFKRTYLELFISRSDLLICLSDAILKGEPITEIITKLKDSQRLSQYGSQLTRERNLKK